MVTFKKSSSGILGPDDLKPVRGPREAVPELEVFVVPNKCSVQFPPPYVTHKQRGREALGAEEVTGPGGQSGWAGRQHSPTLEAVCPGAPRGDLAVKTTGTS